MMTVSAHILSSGVFVAGRDANHVIQNDLVPFGFFDFDDMHIKIHYKKGIVTITTRGVPKRTVVYNGRQGSTILPLGWGKKVLFDPIEFEPNLPDPSTQNWPTGDVTGDIPANVNVEAIESILDAAFQEPGERAWVIVYDGQIIGERYAEGFDQNTPHRSWSMGKSVTAALLGILVGDGYHDPQDPAPIPEWQLPGDPRANITIEHLLQMSSGLDFNNIPMGDPAYFTPDNHHNFIYFEGVNVFDWSTNRPLAHEPGIVWRYRNCDPLSIGRIIRDTVESHYSIDYLEFPQRALYDKIGVRNMIHEVDPYGNFILTGANWGTARDWARFGLLHLQDGVWEDERVLPAGWVDYVTSPAATYEGYGALFWLNRDGNSEELPLDAYWAAGAFGQETLIIPSENLVVARLGWLSQTNFHAVVSEIIEAIH
jgi:CubicO group peptidase (beta-lactamase class C family)